MKKLYVVVFIIMFILVFGYVIFYNKQERNRKIINNCMIYALDVSGSGFIAGKDINATNNEYNDCLNRFK